MSEDVREEFETHPQFKYLEFDRDKDAWGRGKYKHSHIQALWEGYQAATATTEAKWRGLVEKLVEALASVKCDMYDSLPLCSNICEEVEEALTHAAELLGRK